MKWSAEQEKTRIRFRIFWIPTLVAGYWYWLHPCHVRESWESNWGGSGWDAVEVLDDSLSIPI